MVNIERMGSGVMITTDESSNIYPLGSLYSIITEDAEGIVLKMKASRKALIHLLQQQKNYRMQ